MNEQIIQIVERLKGLRDVLDITPEDMANTCGMTVEEYLVLESGAVDISVSVLHTIANSYGIELTTLMFGNEPKMNSYYITRKGKGEAVERTKAYKYQALASGFHDRKGDPFIVTIHPKDEVKEAHLSSHHGQEFNLVLKGRMLININGKELVLEEGDSIYYNSELPHGMKALDGQEVQFLAVII
jgi:Uncharacterized conserved protein, contains double-stranded beta-helix domain